MWLLISEPIKLQNFSSGTGTHSSMHQYNNLLLKTLRQFFFYCPPHVYYGAAVSLTGCWPSSGGMFSTGDLSVSSELTATQWLWMASIVMQKWEDLCSINTYMSWLCIQIRIRMISNGTLATSRCPERYRKHSTTCIHTLASTRTAQPAPTWAVQPGSTRTVQPDGGSSFVMISIRAVFPWWRPAHQEAAWSGYTTKRYLVWQRFAAEHDEEAP